MSRGLQISPSERFGFALGLFATVSQVLIMRESLAIAGGNELVVSVAFTGWFLGVTLGAFVVGRLKKTLPTRLTSSVVAGVGMMFASMMLIRLHRGLLHLPQGVDPSLGVVVLLLLVSCSAGGLSIGALFTLGARILGKDDGVGRMYIAEAVGALIGGLLFSFWLTDLPHLVSFSGATMVLLLGTSLLDQPRPSRVFLLILTGVVFTGLIAGIPSMLDNELNRRVFAALRKATHITTKESPYARVSIGKLGDQYEILSDGRLEYVFPDAWDRPRAVHYALTQHPNPRRMLIVGGGPSDRLSAALAHHLEQVVITHLNTSTIELSRPFYPAVTKQLLGDPRVTVVREDGRRYIKTTDARFDVVLLFPPEPTSAGNNRYYTASFYRSVKQVMPPSGVLTTLSPGGANVLSRATSEVSSSVFNTLRQVFKTVAVIPGTDLMFHASDEQVETRAKYLAKRFDARQVDTSFSSFRFEEIYNRDRMRKVRRQLTKENAAVNTDEKPFVFQMFLQQWEKTLGGIGADHPMVLAQLSRFAWVILATLLAGIILAVLFMRREKSRFPRYDGALSIGVTGAAGMALMWVVLYVFQTVNGTLYSDIAFITGLFMAGLALGAYSSRIHLSFDSCRAATVVDLIMLGQLLLSIPVLSFSEDLPTLLYIWALISGAATGSAFPVMLKRSAKEKRDERPVAALIEGSDHLGAAVGAFITGILTVPIFGTKHTLLYFATLKAITLAGRFRVSKEQSRGRV